MTGRGTSMSFEIVHRRCKIRRVHQWIKIFGASDMNTTRRRALQTSLGAGLLAMAPHPRASGQNQSQTISSEELLRVAEAPVLQVGEISPGR